ncbi:MAG: O-antigen ligase family protein [Patescibacteria group bacterium]
MSPDFRLPFGWSMNKLSLVLFNTLAGAALIALSFTATLPLDPVNFAFFSFIGFLCALYRPGWAFLLLIGMLPYEIISIAPAGFGIMIRPYQWLLALIVLALAVRLALGRFPLEKFVPNIWDVLLIVFGVSSFFSALMSDDQAAALALSVILASFICLYFVCRLFVRSTDDARMLLPFLFSSFLVVSCYAILQNILFLSGRESLEVMAGRPNATFSEADWLGGYLAAIITALGALIVSPALVSRYAPLRTARVIFSVLLFFGFTALILSVSRSAWLAALAGLASALLIFGWQRGIFDALYWRNTQILKRAFFVKLFISLPFCAALLLVYISGLTPFDLLDRSKSVVSGDQKITIACGQAVSLPDRIDSLEALAGYGCEHIRLEDIAAKRAAGAYVTEISRNDPNVDIRQGIYGKVVGIIRAHWFAGVGFGVISEYLGTDGRPARNASSADSRNDAGGGAGLNASNIFLEVWLGAGVIGALAFVAFWVGLAGKWLYLGLRKRSSLALILFSTVISATVFNLFNSGLFLGWLFVFLAFLLITPETSYDKS